jgi:transcriptional regulator GlxA family with amidase domain
MRDEGQIGDHGALRAHDDDLVDGALSRKPCVNEAFGRSGLRMINESGTFSMVASSSFADVTDPEIVVVPGGLGHRDLEQHRALLEWLPQVHETSTWTTSVCTGSIMLAAAGLLDGTPATTHWLERDLLAEHGARPVPDRVVRHGKIFTAAGVSSGIDMALTLIQEMYGTEAAQAVQLGIEYDPEPPVDAGSPEKAPKEIQELVRTAMTAQLTG